MYQEQRFERILMLLEERGNLSVKEMVDELGVSKDTVRRDFYCLSQRNLAQRTHGGILPVKNTSVLCFQERQKGLTEDKKKMADLALSFIKEQSLLFFDVSTLRKGLIFISWEANSTLKTASTTRFTKHRSCNIYNLT